MSLNAAAIRILVEKGLSASDLLAVAEAMECRTKAAERQAKYRQRKKRDVTRDVTLVPKEYISNPPPPSETKVSSGWAAPEKSTRGARLPDDFAVPDEWIDWAIAKRKWSRADAIAEGERFCRYWRAKTGKDATKRDWYGTWQNWVEGSKRPDGCTSASAPDRPFDRAEYEARLAKIDRRDSTGPPGQSIGRAVGRVLDRGAG